MASRDLPPAVAKPPATQLGPDGRATERSLASTPGLAGVAALTIIALANVVVWVAARPADQPTARFVGEVCGAEAVLLFSCSLVLATLLTPIQRAFGGLDRVAVWHRRAALAEPRLELTIKATGDYTPP